MQRVAVLPGFGIRLITLFKVSVCGAQLNVANARQFITALIGAAQQAARALFAGAAEGGSVPTRELGEDELKKNAKVIDMMILLGLTKSRGEGRKLIKGGGVTLNGKKVTDEFYELQDSDFDGGEAMLKKGKKVFYKIVRK